MSYELTNTAIKIEIEDKTYTLRRIKRGDLTKFKEKYNSILNKFMECNASLGEFLMEEKNFNLLVDVCKLIPVDELTNDEFFDFKILEQDYLLIAQLFISESFKDGCKLELKPNEGWESSAICRFNFWDYDTAMGNAQIHGLDLRMKNEEKNVDKLLGIEERKNAIQEKREKLTI